MGEGPQWPSPRLCDILRDETTWSDPVKVVQIYLRELAHFDALEGAQFNEP